MVLRRVRRHLAYAGHLAGKGVDVGHLEIGSRLGRHGQQVQHRVGRAAHGDVERHGVQERGARGDAAGQHGLVAVFIVLVGILYDLARRLAEKLRAHGVRGQDGAVAGQGQADGLGEAVHRVGREHAGAAAAGRAGVRFDLRHLGVAHGRVGGLDHRVDEVEPALPQHAGLHRAAGHEDGRDVEPHGGEHHTRGDLVAVADAHERIRLVRVDHIFYAVGDDVAGRKGIQHAVVAHGNAIVHGDRIEFSRKTAQFFNFSFYDLACIVQMGVSGNELGKGIGDRDDRLAELAALHPVRHPERTSPGHPAAFEGYTTTIFHD